MRFDLGHFFAGIFWLILFGLVVRDWSGANSVLQTSLSGGNAVIKTLQLR